MGDALHERDEPRVLPALPNALAIGRGPTGRQGAVVGLSTAAVDLGGVVGTPVCGALAEVFGHPVMYGVMALASCGGVVLMAKDGRLTNGGGGG